MLGKVVRANTEARVRMVQGSHIVVRRLYPHDRCYIFQNADNRIIFAIPYERDFTLIGTTDGDYRGDPQDVHATEGDIAYLCNAASEYFRVPVVPSQVVWTYSGVRPLYDDGASAAQEATRDYVLNLDAPEPGPALLSIFGGKITTYRRLAEAALAKLAPYLPQPSGSAAGWTANLPLPGGDFARDGFEAEVAGLRGRHPWLAAATATRLVRAYGTGAETLIGDAHSMDGLGEIYGADLTHAELVYLARHEWATTAADVVWRRTKLGLRLAPAQIARIDEAMAALTRQPQTA